MQMAQQQVVFNDGAAYERMMGLWSRLAGNIFIDWLAPVPGLRWVDVGCGNGAFTELVTERCKPAEIHGVDPSEQQLAFARTRPAGRVAKFQQGDAMALPFADASFDAAVMALVIFFVPEPPKGVAEMVRVVRKGGLVATYAWDIEGGGFPIEPMREAMRAMGITPMGPPRPEASSMEALRCLWTNAGLEAIDTREITVQRTYKDFDEFWTTSLLGSSVGPTIAAMPPGDIDRLKAETRARLVENADRSITCGGRANAIKGRVRG
jgi:ubiquinone/menaquinone biosynthesis C-methylase UbiE